MLAKVYGVTSVSVLKKAYKIYTDPVFKIVELKNVQEKQDTLTGDNDKADDVITIYANEVLKCVIEKF